MFLLLLCLILVQGTLQQPQNEGASSHGATSFSCVGRVAGYYADINSGCQLYHLCDVDGRRFTHSCPNATLFQQRMMICDHWYMVNCSRSENDYSANLLIGQRDQPFIGNDHVHHREPVKSFTVGSLQHPNWFPTFADRRPEENDNTVPQQVSSIHFTYTPPPPSSHSVQSTSRPKEQRFVTSEHHISRPTSPQAETKYRNLNSGQSASTSGDEAVTTPMPHTTRPSTQRGVIYSDVRSSQTSTSTFEKQRFISSVPYEYQETRSASPQREARYRDLNVDHGSSRQYVVKTSPESNSSRYHKTERKLPDAYTNNPFFQTLVNRPTTEQNPPHQVPSKLEDIANVKISHFQNPQSSRKIKKIPINSDNHQVQNVSPSSRSHKFSDPYSNNRFIQTVPVPTIKSADDSGLRDKDDDLDNIVELHILDPRQMFYIPESNNHEIGKRNSTVLFISVPSPLHNNSHGFMHFRNDIRSLQGTNPQCPRCHPAFLSPGKCQPCVIIR